MGYNEAELRKRALVYVEAERTPCFRDEVNRSLEKGDWEDLNDRFYTTLNFGTAGMRGVIGGGTNRINTFMVEKVTQGLSEYLLGHARDPLVVIAYDSRHFSKEFALSAALVLAGNNIRVRLFDTLHPVPMLSFSVRYLQATAGIVVTASHNPAFYNGYKVYSGDGGQVTPPDDVGIAALANAVLAEGIKRFDEKEARKSGLLKHVSPKVDEAYYHMALCSLRRPALVQNSPITVAYTPLHGSGNVPILHLLKRLGIRTVVVKDQELPDGDFPTVKLPNPESAEAMTEVIALAKKEKADIVIGTDPDADRMGIAIPKDKEKTEYQLLSGNQIGTLLCDYLIHTAKELHKDPRVPVVVKSIVTTDLIKRITEKNGGIEKDVLTGFKYIAEQIDRLENPKSKERYFLFGCEESYGFLTVSAVRDKDAVSSSLAAVEMVCSYAKQGISLQDRLDAIYQEYGYSAETVFTRAYPGEEGKRRMQSIMEDIRRRKPGEMIAGRNISSLTDLLKEGTGLPKSDVVIIRFVTGEKLVVRPSGTEPKIKYYLFLSGKREDLEPKVSSINAEFEKAL
ncbi:MAG: phospho-sugar mutase [Sphaerochaetaceae bacterium]|jgi:phosphoglucomutase